MLLWHQALHPSSTKLGMLVAAGASGACLALLEAPGAAASERICALGILLGVVRAGEAGRMDVAGAHTAKVCHMREGGLRLCTRVIPCRFPRAIEQERCCAPDIPAT